MNRIVPLLLFISILVSFTTQKADAQDMIRGTIKDQKTNEPLVGVTVMIKGTTRGVISDIDGAYTLDVSGITKPRVTFSYIGYKSREVEIKGQSVVDILLSEDFTELQEFVVTAFGVETEKKSINYAVQEVKGQEIQRSGQNNVINALQGKVAGTQITNSSGSPGSSSHILIRGANSISESTINQPLFIVDGIPIDNTVAFGGINRGFDINPNDIESITVLKSGAASALYGSEAANGAIIITTKRGKAGVTSVTYSSTFSMEQAFRITPKQHSFKQGNVGVFDPQSQANWGPQVLPGDPTFDNVNNFLRTGSVQKHDISLTTGSEKSSLLASVNYLDHQGIHPAEALSRFGLFVKGENKISEKLSLETSLNYIKTNNSRAPFGNMINAYLWPINDDMSISRNPDGTKRWLIDRPDGQEWSQRENPHWAANNNSIKDEVDRIIALSTLRYSISDNLNLTYRLGADISNFHYKQITRPGSAGTEELFSGVITEADRYSDKITSTLLLEFEKNLTEKIQISALVGHNAQWDNARSTTIRGTGYRNPNLDNINNLSIFFPDPSQGILRRRIVGAFTDVRVNYDGIVYLGATARNDWSSTLGFDFQGYFYPSVNLGVVFSEFLNSQSILSFGKVRASYAAIGKDARPGQTITVLQPFAGIGGGFRASPFAGNPNLAPEISSELEIGTNLIFYNGKMKLDVAYYNMVSDGMIIQSRVSPASGGILLTFNAGSVRNRGVEIMADFELFSQNDFQWNLLANISGNRSRVVDLPSFVSRLPVTPGQLISSARPISILGEPLLGIEGTTYLYNEFGQLVVDENGVPRIGTYLRDEDGNFVLNSDGTRATDPTRVNLGNREPLAIIGITNSFMYKNFDLSFMFDIRIGGDVLNAANATMIGNGSSGYLEDYRNRETTFNAVVEQEGGVFTPNTESVILNQSFFATSYTPVGSNFVEDATWARLRYMSIGYNLPQSIAESLRIKNIHVSVTGRNLLLFTKYSGGDPEVNYAGAGVGGSGTVGLDYFNVPQVQGFDLNIRASF